jgi:allophanate hydrolase
MIVSLDIAALTTGYETGAFAVSDVINHVYDRIAAQGERSVWISLRSREEALSKAHSTPKGVLFGIPFAVKDNIDVAGLPTTCACPDFSYFPERSARVIELLEAAGAIVIGKTNMDQFATGLVGTRSPYGVPVNPFDKDYIPGGSSSGSAVAVASGIVSFALGTDTAGSGRVPAGFNNIVGLKPAKGMISARGVVPACRTQDTVSVFALTVSDAERVFSAAARFDPEDAFARQPLTPCIRKSCPTPVKVGVPDALLEFFGDQSTAKLYSAAVDRARDLGAEIVAIDFWAFQQAASLLYQGPWVAERLAAIKGFVATQSPAMNETVGNIILAAERLSAVDAFEGFYKLAELTRASEAEWQKIDILLLPTAPAIYKIADVLANPVQLNSNLGLYTNFVNLMDLSALAVPAGLRDDGLPFGVTLIAQPSKEAELGVFGDLLHRALPGAMLGATAVRVDNTPLFTRTANEEEFIQIAVVGAHLTGQPLNCQLVERNARLVRTARTAAGYSFYALENTTPAKPGLTFDGKGAGGIEVEIWKMDVAAFGSFVTLVPPPLGIGTVKLADGSTVKGFLCEAHAVRDAQDITAHGGWRAWISRTR